MKENLENRRIRKGTKIIDGPLKRPNNTSHSKQNMKQLEHEEQLSLQY